MSEAIENAVTQIAAVVAGVSGIRAAPTYPRETENVDPFAVTYVTNGTLTAAPIGNRKTLFDVAIDMLIPRTDLARDMARILPYVDTIPAALMGEVSGTGDKFTSTIETFRAIDFEFLPAVDYAGVQHIGYRFILRDVKILVNL